MSEQWIWWSSLKVKDGYYDAGYDGNVKILDVGSLVFLDVKEIK